jgi:hypothetical protein
VTIFVLFMFNMSTMLLHPLVKYGSGNADLRLHDRINSPHNYVIYDPRFLDGMPITVIFITIVGVTL